MKNISIKFKHKTDWKNYCKLEQLAGVIVFFFSRSLVGLFKTSSA